MTAKTATPVLAPIPPQTTTSAEKAQIEREIAALGQQAQAEKDSSIEAARRRAALEQRRAVLAVEAARLAELELDENQRQAHERQRAAAQAQAIRDAEARKEVDGLIALRTTSLQRIEKLSAELGEETARAFSLAGQVDSAAARAGLPVPGAAPGARALQRHLASRIAYQVQGSLGGRIKAEYRDLGRTPLVTEPAS